MVRTLPRRPTAKTFPSLRNIPCCHRPNHAATLGTSRLPAQKGRLVYSKAESAASMAYNELLERTLSNFTGDLAGFIPTPGLLTYDFGNGAWANVTNTPYVSASKTIEWSGMELVPFGPNGLMVVIGDESSDLTSSNPGGQERTLTRITLFDPVRLEFYRQTATGDKVPFRRNRFCIAGVGDSTKVGGRREAYPRSWDMPELRDLIMHNVPKPSDSSSVFTSPSVTALATTTPSGNSSKGPSEYAKLGVGVGSAIGGVIFLLILSAFLVVCLRRRRNSHAINHRNGLSGQSNRHELSPAPRIQGRRPVARIYLVELDAGEVAAEKGTGMRTPEQGSSAARSPGSVSQPGYELSPTSSGTSASSPPLKLGYYGVPEPLQPPTPLKLVVSPPDFRSQRRGVDHLLKHTIYR
ncbi:MAG: hypothetical protein Q9225_005632 [Loekoesia sp. 1 TL-2023]